MMRSKRRNLTLVLLLCLSTYIYMHMDGNFQSFVLGEVLGVIAIL